MKAWFLGLQLRERAILLGGVAIALVIVLVMSALKLRSATAELRERADDQEQLLVALARAEGIVPTTDQASGGPNLVVLVNRTAEELGLSFPRTRPEGSDVITVNFQDLPFDGLVDWLVTLETAHSLSVDVANVNGSRNPGVVSGTITLRRS